MTVFNGAIQKEIVRGWWINQVSGVMEVTRENGGLKLNVTTAGTYQWLMARLPIDVTTYGQSQVCISGDLWGSVGLSQIGVTIQPGGGGANPSYKQMTGGLILPAARLSPSVKVVNTLPDKAGVVFGTNPYLEFFFEINGSAAAVTGAITFANMKLEYGADASGVEDPYLRRRDIGAAPAPFSIDATPASGDTITMPPGCTHLILTPAAALANLTIILPTSPEDGQPLQIFSSAAIAALTLTPAAYQGITGAPTSIAANGAKALFWSAHKATWYPAL